MSPSQKLAGTLVLTAALPFSLAGGQSNLQPAREAAYAAEFYAELDVDGNQATLSLNDPRPLAKAADLLERRFGWRVHYEDPPYAHESDLRDMTSTVAKERLRDLRRPLVPRGGALEVRFELTAATGLPKHSEAVIEAILIDHHKRGNPGVFAVRMSREGFTVLPDSVKDSRGLVRAVTPILDTPISFPARERSLGEALKLILDRLSGSTGEKIMAGMVGANFLHLNRTRIGAGHERARDVIERLITSYYRGPAGYSPRRSMAWRVYYQPGWGYSFNLHSLDIPGP